MPTRLLYEKTCVSETLAEVSAEEERMFFRLVTKADDHGRYYARPEVLLGNLFPLQAGRITASQVQDWRDRLEEVGLIAVYSVEGREYLVITTWSTYQRQRANKSKFPDPPFRGHSHADACNGGQMPPVPGTRYPVSGGRNAGAGVRGPGADAHAREAAAPPPALPADEQTQDGGFAVPDLVAGFHGVMLGTQGYRPSPAFLAQVAERYGSLDLTQEALTMADWLADDDRNRRSKRPTAKFILGWLDRSLEDRSATAVPDGRGTVDRPEPVEVVPPVEADERLWAQVMDRVRPDVSRSNFETWVSRLDVLGRDGGGALLLRAPPGSAGLCRPYQTLIRRALIDLGDPQATRAAIVE